MSENSIDLRDRFNRQAVNGAIYTGKAWAVWLDREGETQVTPRSVVPDDAHVMFEATPAD
jgi:hypothetical protein